MAALVKCLVIKTGVKEWTRQMPQKVSNAPYALGTGSGLATTVEVKPVPRLLQLHRHTVGDISIQHLKYDPERRFVCVCVCVLFIGLVIIRSINRGKVHPLLWGMRVLTVGAAGKTIVRNSDKLNSLLGPYLNWSKVFQDM